MSLSDRVYKILVENSKENKGGKLETPWKEEKLHNFSTEHVVDARKNKRNIKLSKPKRPEIESYDLEDNLIDEIDYLGDKDSVNTKDYSGGCMECGSCGCGGNVRKPKKQNKPKQNKPKKQLNNSLAQYNACLNHIKSKGYTHKEAQNIMKQMKEEFGGNFWKDFGKGFKKGFTGTLKTVAPVLPYLL